jgi:ribonuclease R
LAKRARPGKGTRDGGGGPAPRGRRQHRGGKHARLRAKSDATDARKAGANARKGRVQNAREAIVREIRSPGIDGQRLIAEERDGERWEIECLGEPVEVGARISFSALVPEGERQGQMIRLVDEKRSNWLCTLERSPQGLRLVPFGGLDATNLVLSEGDSKGAENRSRVLVVALERPASSTRRDKETTRSRSNRSQSGAGRTAQIAVRVVKIFGPAFEPDSDHAALVWKHRLATDFSRRSRLEAAEIGEALEPKELERRLDLRHLPFVTIDPASARDHDDAVFAESRQRTPLAIVDESGKPRSNPKGLNESTWTHRLWIAIADVSHFVQAGGWIDAEARRRGNSVYFPDRSIPMLPARLSSDLCSLRAGVDRLAVVVELRLAAGGHVADALFHEAVVRSHAGLTYEEASDWLSQDPEPESADAPDWGSSLRCLDEIALALSRNRREAGALTLELPEIEIVLGEDQRPVDARVRTRNRAHGLVEEAMLAANRAVARALDNAQRETIHRVHPEPSGQKLAALAVLLDQLGLATEGDLAEPGVLAKILENVKGMPSEERVHVAALRSMSQARYEPVSRGHYALRFDHYLHFTSPIRRYADLEVHRALKHMLRDQSASPVESGGGPNTAARLAIWLSGRERVATEVERDAQAMACCSLMSERLGEHFAAQVTGATEFGLFVRLEAPSASGLVPMRALDGYWTYDPEREVLQAERSGRRIGLGDRISVRLREVDPDRIRITFALA